MCLLDLAFFCCQCRHYLCNNHMKWDFYIPSQKLQKPPFNISKDVSFIISPSWRTSKKYFSISLYCYCLLIDSGIATFDSQACFIILSTWLFLLQIYLYLQIFPLHKSVKIPRPADYFTFFNTFGDIVVRRTLKLRQILIRHAHVACKPADKPWLFFLWSTQVITLTLY